MPRRDEAGVFWAPAAGLRIPRPVLAAHCGGRRWVAACSGAEQAVCWDGRVDDGGSGLQ